MLGVLQVSLGVLIAMALVGIPAYWYIQGITQKMHAVLRNFPIVGHLRYFFENLSEGFCDKPMLGRLLVNISGMSFGAISEPAVRALSCGAQKAGCWMVSGAC